MWQLNIRVLSLVTTQRNATQRNATQSSATQRTVAQRSAVQGRAGRCSAGQGRAGRTAHADAEERREPGRHAKQGAVTQHALPHWQQTLEHVCDGRGAEAQQRRFWTKAAAGAHAKQGAHEHGRCLHAPLMYCFRSVPCEACCLSCGGVEATAVHQCLHLCSKPIPCLAVRTLVQQHASECSQCASSCGYERNRQRPHVHSRSRWQSSAHSSNIAGQQALAAPAGAGSCLRMRMRKQACMHAHL